MRKMKQRNAKNSKDLDMPGRIQGINHKEKVQKTEFIETVSK